MPASSVKYSTFNVMHVAGARPNYMMVAPVMLGTERLSEPIQPGAIPYRTAL